MQNTEIYNGIYAMHKYWGKKPFNEISYFINKYSNEGDIVLDSFCGSGVTLIEALKNNRKCIGVDLNPLAIKLSNVCTHPVEISSIEITFINLKKKLKEEINALYTVNYKNENTLITHIVWKDNFPTEIWYSNSDKRKNVRCGTMEDLLMAQKPKIKPKWYPTTEMFENSRINVNKKQTVADLFTPRALVALSLINDEIKKIKDENLRNVFELVFTGTLSQASKLVFVIRSKNSPNGNDAKVGSWTVGYWIPNEHFEINVWNCFENRYKKILRGEKEINQLFGNNKPELLLFNCSATNIPIENDSVDYVFIDPPHANRILYMEQSLMWNAWLGLENEIDWNKEIVISEAKDRKDKNLENFIYLMDQAIAEIKRILKENRYFSFAFNCLDDETWLNTLNLFIKHGFELEDIVPLEYSARSLIQNDRDNALKTDFVLTFKNTSKNKDNKIVFASNDNLYVKILNILSNNPNYEVYNVINQLFMNTIPKGFIYRVTDIADICKKIRGDFYGKK